MKRRVAVVVIGILIAIGGAVWRRSTHQQTLDRPAARQTAPQQARGEDAGVVDDHEVARAQQVGERGDAGMRERTARAVQIEQSRCAAIEETRIG